ncbi:tyrosine-type recombinase/integrase [Paraburkholderia sp. Ac-20336]|uniref:tyrosine-type recombinase/integrase n=1 Tax=Burkholderiaceae TaxID=119060 RepID=UPI001423A804|nr:MULTISPECIES: tyrosine-type recombinase/integrase [Burkholderiaceae]MBN3804842.1 tyrosine-type recombinase/integrase [Paraburkholderia sp. Ac-20336]NIF52699.1 tyrosine-type recombinase/integrase [Burkholderia sp. Ax-1724]
MSSSAELTGRERGRLLVSLRAISHRLFPCLRRRSVGTPYTRSGLNSMWRRAKAQAEVTLDVQFKDIRAIGATDAAKRGEHREAIQTRLAHTSAQTTEIYIKEAIPETSSIDLDLPWGSKVLDIV